MLDYCYYAPIVVTFEEADGGVSPGHCAFTCIPATLLIKSPQ
jgi:hypothetical protein